MIFAHVKSVTKKLRRYGHAKWIVETLREKSFMNCGRLSCKAEYLCATIDNLDRIVIVP